MKKCKNNCSETTTTNAQLIYDLRKSFWKGEPTPSERRSMMQILLKSAHTAYLNLRPEERMQHDSCFGQEPFVFVINGKEVCHKAYVNMLGLADFKGHKTPTWQDEVSICLGKFFCTL